MGKTLSIQNVNKSFTVDGQKVDVLKDINLEVQEGEFIAIVGHSGCGKSTLLKIIAGLEKNDTGLVTVDGKEVNWTRHGSWHDFSGTPPVSVDEH